VFGGKETLESFDAYRPSEIPEKYIDWMRNLDYYIKLEKFIVVHAGFNFKIDDPFSDKRSMLWVRDYEVIPEKINNRRVIHGHVPVNLEFIDLAINNNSYKFIDLDNGVYMARKAGYGNLLALEVNSMEYVAQPLIDEVTYKM
jgi:serine/threonine protein phosphatase 1